MNVLSDVGKLVIELVDERNALKQQLDELATLSDAREIELTTQLHQAANLTCALTLERDSYLRQLEELQEAGICSVGGP